MLVFNVRSLAVALVSCAMLVSFPLAPGAPAAALAAEVTPKGPWSATVTYVLNDLVTSRGSTWRARRASKGKLPGATSPSSAVDWELFAAGFNPLGEWSATRGYEVNDLVTRLRATWRAKNTNLNKAPESNAANWVKFADAGLTGATGARGATGATGPQGPAGPSAVENGTQTVPAFRFTSSPDTGMFSPGNGKIALASNGALFLHDIGPDNLGLGIDALNPAATGAGNVALGNVALFANTTGSSNVAVGFVALQNNTTGSSNTAVGFFAARDNQSGNQNAAVGGRALQFNVAGSDNTAVGFQALQDNKASGNTALGSLALTNNTTGIKNTAVGQDALAANTTGNENTALGYRALQSNTTALGNTAVGSLALANNIDGAENTALGWNALLANTTGRENTALGFRALHINTTGLGNTAVGRNSLQDSTTGDNNTALGHGAMQYNETGQDNVALGRSALINNTTGSENTALGKDSLRGHETGSGNVGVGFEAGAAASNPQNSVFVGNRGSFADTATIKIGTQGTQTSAFIAGISGVTVANSAAVLINTSTGQLGTVSSSRRYKEDIHPMGAMSDMLAALRPVTFRYIKPNADGSQPLEYGLIAEEVAEAFPYLAVFNDKGQPETVKYHLLPTFLLEGFQEQQRVIAEQQATIDAQAEELAEVQSRLAAIEALLQPPAITAASAAR